LSSSIIDEPQDLGLIYIFLPASDLKAHSSLQLTFTSITLSYESNIDVALNLLKLSRETKNHDRFLLVTVAMLLPPSLTLLPAFPYPNDRMPARQQGETSARSFITFTPLSVMAPLINSAIIILRQRALPESISPRPSSNK